MRRICTSDSMMIWSRFWLVGKRMQVFSIALYCKGTVSCMQIASSLKVGGAACVYLILYNHVSYSLLVNLIIKEL